MARAMGKTLCIITLVTLCAFLGGMFFPNLLRSLLGPVIFHDEKRRFSYFKRNFNP